MRNNNCQLVALVGRPNVGKSSLFNRLTKTNKAIVDPTPGVTRDRHYAKVEWQDKAFMLVDTGGIESDPLEEMVGLIQNQTLQAINEADSILFMLDGREGLTTEDYEILNFLRREQKPLYCLVNKVDTPEKENELLSPFYELGLKSIWPVSAEHGYGVKTFLSEFIPDLQEVELEDNLPEDTLRVAFIGRPNVGKSSLVNRLLGEDRMVVSSIPGTTRDSVDTLLEKNGTHYLLIDTAGIRRKGKVKEKVEKFSVMRALRTMERCDIVLVLIDAEEGITEQDAKVVGYSQERGRACLIVINKWDLIRHDKKKQKYFLEDVELQTRFVGFAPTLRLSALDGKGVGKLFPALKEVYRQFCREFSTNRLNKVLKKAVEGHSPPLHKGRRVKLYYTTQLSSKPPTFVIFANYPKGVHFSYYRYLVNQYRTGLGLDNSPIKIVVKERQRKQYG